MNEHRRHPLCLHLYLYFILQPFVIQLFREFLDVDDSQPRPVDMLEYVEVRVIGDDKFSIRCHGAVHELIVVGIGLYQPEMDVHLLEYGGV